MKDLKRLIINNKSLEKFDELMNCHLNKIEELEINEININSKLYNIISLCTNLKRIIIKGDLRTDVNKIFFNICKPKELESIILDSVKLPSIKKMTEFHNLSLISLNNIKLSNIETFLTKLNNPERIIALNLTNVDFGKSNISICKKFKNLKYLNLNNLKNCIFDNFDFLIDNKNIVRFEFCNNKIGFEQVNNLMKGTYKKKINIGIKTKFDCDFINKLEILERNSSLILNSCDLEKAMSSINFYRLNKLTLILNENIELTQYIKKFKKTGLNLTIVIKDISYFNIEDAKMFQEKMQLNFVKVLQCEDKINLNDNKNLYSLEDYINIRQEFDKIKKKVISRYSSELDRFDELYDYFKSNIKYTEEKISIKDVFIKKISSYNYYSLVINSFLKDLNFDSKIIKGSINGEENLLWNQVKIDDNWYNFDIAYELRSKYSKKYLQYVFKGNLLNDDQFYKIHTPYLEYKPKMCRTNLQIKRINKYKTNFIKTLYRKMKNILKINGQKMLTPPKKDERGE